MMADQSPQGESLSPDEEKFLQFTLRSSAIIAAVLEFTRQRVAEVMRESGENSSDELLVTRRMVNILFVAEDLAVEERTRLRQEPAHLRTDSHERVIESAT
jgi:hypothetical protein